MSASATIRKVQHTAIRDYVKHNELLTEEIEALITRANTDLYEGPAHVRDGAYPGFVLACRRIRDALDLGDLWVCEDGLIADSEPDWSELPELWTHYSARDVRRVLVGSELVSYL